MQGRWKKDSEPDFILVRNEADAGGREERVFGQLGVELDLGHDPDSSRDRGPAVGLRTDPNFFDSGRNQRL